MVQKTWMGLQEELIAAQHRFIKAHKNICFSDIRKSEFFLLEMIAREDEEREPERGIRVSEIAKKLRVTVPAVSKMLKALEEKHYIERKSDAKDRRNTIVSVTQEGEEARQKVFEEMERFTGRTIEEFGEENAKELIRLLKLYTEIVQKENVNMKNAGGSQ